MGHRACRFSRKALLLCSPLLWFAGCLAEPDPAGTAHSELGSVDTYASTCLITYYVDGGGWEGHAPTAWHCVGTLIAPDVVITSRGCDGISHGMFSGQPSHRSVDVSCGPGVHATESFWSTDAIRDRYASAGRTSGPSLLRLSESPLGAGIVPARVRAAPLSPALVGTDVVAVSWTPVETEGGGSRLQRTVTSRSVSAVSSERIELDGDCSATTVRSQHLFKDFGNGPELIAVAAIGCGDWPGIRVDRYADSFIFPYIDRHHGACTADGQCVEEGCDTPDPDCDPCSWGSGGCTRGCEVRDWDCPIGAFAGDACSADDDCEHAGRCVSDFGPAGEPYCTRACDPAFADSCPGNMECTDIGGATSECVYAPERATAHDHMSAPEPTAPGCSSTGGERPFLFLVLLAGVCLATLRRRRSPVAG